MPRTSFIVAALAAACGLGLLQVAQAHEGRGHSGRDERSAGPQSGHGDHRGHGGHGRSHAEDGDARRGGHHHGEAADDHGLGGDHAEPDDDRVAP